MRQNYRSSRLSTTSAQPNSELSFQVASRYRHNLVIGSKHCDENLELTINTENYEYNYNFNIDQQIYDEIKSIQKKSEDAKNETAKMSSILKPNILQPSSSLLQPQKLFNQDQTQPDSLTKSQNEEIINLVQPKNLNSDPFDDAFQGTIDDRQALNEIFGFSETINKNSESPVSPPISENKSASPKPESSNLPSKPPSNLPPKPPKPDYSTNNLANLIQLDSFRPKLPQHHDSINTKIKNVVENLPNFNSDSLPIENLQYSTNHENSKNSKNSSAASSFVEIEPEHDSILDQLEDEQLTSPTSNIKISVPKSSDESSSTVHGLKVDSAWADHLHPNHRDIASQLAEAGYAKTVILAAFLVDSSVKRKKEDEQAQKEKNKSIVDKIFRKNSKKNNQATEENTSLAYGIVDYVESLGELEKTTGNLDQAVTIFIWYNGQLKPAHLHCQIASMGLKVKPEHVVNMLNSCKGDMGLALHQLIDRHATS